MNGDAVASMVAGILCLTLVGSSLIARRLDWGQTLRMALIWAAIFAAAVFVISVFTGRPAAKWVGMDARSPALASSATLHNVYYRAI